MTKVGLIRLIESDLEYQIDQSDQNEVAGSQKKRRGGRVNRFGDSSKLNIGAGSVYKPHYTE